MGNCNANRLELYKLIYNVFFVFFCTLCKIEMSGSNWDGKLILGKKLEERYTNTIFRDNLHWVLQFTEKCPEDLFYTMP